MVFAKRLLDVPNIGTARIQQHGSRFLLRLGLAAMFLLAHRAFLALDGTALFSCCHVISFADESCEDDGA